MSRLSLKPGGEPGTWEVVLQAGENGIPFTYVCPDVSDEVIMDIRYTISEYLDAKYVAVEPEKPKAKSNWRVWVVYACSAILVFIWFMTSHPTTPVPASTGGVIDQLCMRPDIECSTSIRYVHPQAGVPHQERETYSADSLSQAHLEEQ